MLGELVREPVSAAGVGDVAGVVPGAAPGALRLAAGVGHLRPLALPPSPPVASAATPGKQYIEDLSCIHVNKIQKLSTTDMTFGLVLTITTSIFLDYCTKLA